MLKSLSCWRKPAWLGLVLCIALILLASPDTTLAASTRYLSPSGTDAGNCASSATPCKTITYTIAQANAGDTLLAAAGTYIENVELVKNVTLSGASLSSTIIDGNADGLRVFTVHAGVIAKLNELTIQNGMINGAAGGIYNLGTLTLSNVIVTHNRTSGGTVPSHIGGGIYNQGTLTIKSSYFSDNSAEYVGGGIYNTSEATLTLKGVTFIHNSSGEGSGIYNAGGNVNLKDVTFTANVTSGSGGGIYSTGNLTAKNVTFTANVVGGSGGGLNTGGTSTLTNVTFYGNTSDSGGGMANSGTATLNGVTFMGNVADGRGGGILNSANVTLNNVELRGNSANFGGGMDNLGTATAALTNVTFGGNSASTKGGAIENVSSGAVTLTNVTVSGNIAIGYGGGIYNSGGMLSLINVTLSGNAASNSGGGIYNDSGGNANLKNNIVANSVKGGNCAGPIAVTSQGHNLDSGNTCGFNLGLKDILNRDPLLGPLKSNGGFTPTMALSKKSPAIDKGTNSGCPHTDQRGIARPHDGNGDGKALCDIGAYEY